MQLRQLSWLTATDRRREIVIVLLWSGAIAAVYLQAIFQRAALTLFDDLAVFAICIIAGTALLDLARVILGYFATVAVSMILVFIFTALPALDGSIAPPADQTIVTLWISIIVKLIFPAQLLLFLVGSVIGAAIGEHYLS
ncbi:MAG TPA: hypothetical protein VE955_05580 [Candidatus Dormibacteraeota bacterium]|nr:hypothetical protein [Candidatus Dormibacteraeota bacterium]